MDRPRLLLVGWLNSPHVGDWGREMAARGWEVHIAGEAEPEQPPAAPPAGVADVHAMPAVGPPGLAAFRLAGWLRSRAGEIRPDVTHAHWLQSFGWMAARAGLRPLVVSAWGSDVLRAGPLMRRRSRKALRAADAVLADSAHLAREADRLAGGGLAVEVVNWGVDLQVFAPGGEAQRTEARRRLGLDGRPLVLGPRGLDARYNPGTLIEAFAEVRRELPDAVLALKHPHRSVPAEIGAAIERSGLSDGVRIIGHVSLDELLDWYRVADASVSIPDTDSSPRTVWELLACGCPTVVSDLPWTAEWLRDGDHAMVVPVEAGAVARAIVSILRDPALARRLAENGRRLAREKMDKQTEMDRVEAIYRRLIT